MKKIIIAALFSVLIGCAKKDPQPIKMGTELMGSLNTSDQKNFMATYENVLQLKPNSLSKLINFNCNSEKGCIELASIITQTIKHMGEDKFIVLAKDLSTTERSTLRGMIKGGLKYGYRLNSKVENGKAEEEFPKLISFLNR